VLTLLLRHGKPVGAGGGILAVHLLFELDPWLLPAVLFALFTVVMVCGHRTVAASAAAPATALAASPSAWTPEGVAAIIIDFLWAL